MEYCCKVNCFLSRERERGRERDRDRERGGGGEGGETLNPLRHFCLPVFYFVGWVFNHISGFRPFQNVFCLKQVFALPQKVNLIYIIVFNFYVS